MLLAAIVWLTALPLSAQTLPDGDGTKESPWVPSQITQFNPSNYNGSEGWVSGFIVGALNDNVEYVFGANACESSSFALVIASTPDETDLSTCFVVRFRTPDNTRIPELDLYYRPQLLGHVLSAYGKLVYGTYARHNGPRFDNIIEFFTDEIEDPENPDPNPEPEPEPELETLKDTTELTYDPSSEYKFIINGVEGKFNDSNWSSQWTSNAQNPDLLLKSPDGSVMRKTDNGFIEVRFVNKFSYAFRLSTTRQDYHVSGFSFWASTESDTENTISCNGKSVIVSAKTGQQYFEVSDISAADYVEFTISCAGDALSHFVILSGFTVILSPTEQDYAGALPASAGAVDWPGGIDASEWYDIDGDGVLEFSYSSTNYDRAYLYKPTVSSTLFATKMAQRGGWFNRISASFPIVASSVEFRNQMSFWQDDYSIKSIDAPIPGNTQTYFYLIDYTNSGVKNIVESTKNTKRMGAYKLEDDYTYSPDCLDVISWNEYNNLRGDLKLSSGGDGIPGMEDMYGRDGGGTSYGEFRNMDINGDGLPDMLAPSSGKYYLNTGLNSFVENSFGGQTEIRDLNGDGLADLVVYNRTDKRVTCIMTKSDGTSSETVLLEGYPCGERIWCCDFDRDGDVDVLVPVNTIASMNAAFLIVYENDGTGHFRQYDNVIEGDVAFKQCLDIDADGNYEILAIAGKTELRSYKVNGHNIADTYTNVYTSSNTIETILPANIDNTGLMRLVLGPRYSGKHKLLTLSDNANHRPSAPGIPTLTFDRTLHQLKVNWSAATDAESSPADLTYEIRIGTAPGLDDVCVTDALPDGRRRSMNSGANGYLTYRTFDVSFWPAGRYYVSVQAVDPNMLGSEFSQYAVFDKSAPATRFMINVPQSRGAGDVVTLRLHSAPEAGVTYQWNLDGAEIVEASADNTQVKVRWLSGGKKAISLTAIAPDGTSSEPYVRYLNLEPASMTQLDASISAANPDYRRYASEIFDLDADGSEEFLDASYYKFYEQDADGNASTIKKLYNTNLTLRYDYYNIVDVNRDGLLDILAVSSGGTHQLVENLGDKNLLIGSEYSIGLYYTNFADIDNDGVTEEIQTVCTDKEHGAYVLAKHSDDYSSCTISKIFLPECQKITGFFDFNGDGLMDIIGYSGGTNYALTDGHRHIYYNNGTDTFTPGEFLPRHPEYGDPKNIGDFDFDGKPDYVFDDSAYGFGVTFYSEYEEIWYGNGRKLVIQCPDGNPFGGVKAIADLDNNGMMDFSFSGSDTNVQLYVNPDYSYSIMPNDKISFNNDKFLHCNDGTLTIGGNLLAPAAANARPSAPGGMRSAVADGFLNIEWDAATDAETPRAGLRYNISVRHKGMTGEGAYLLSPMNMERDNVSVPSGHRLLNGPRIKIPLASIPAGEYEVRVQAVDGQNLTGAFSQPYALTVSPYTMLEVETETMVGRETPVKVSANVAATSLDFGSDAKITEKGSGNYTAVWSQPGLKQLKLNGTVLATVNVHEALSADFTLPEELAAGAEVSVLCASASKGTWESIDAKGKATLLVESTAVDHVTVSDSAISFTLRATGSLTLRHTIEENYGTATDERTAAIAADNSRPEISHVDIEGNRAVIHFAAASAPANATELKVYRETSRLNEYELIATLPMTADSYVDAESSPASKADRYCVSAALPYGETAMSEAHQPLHLQLNRGLGDEINLRWSKYEGREVATYQIYGGNDRENLTPVASVSGHNSSYTASAPLAYYAVGTVFGDARRVRGAGAAAASGASVRSNVAAVAEATPAVLATGLTISAYKGATEVELNSANTLRLIATVQPSGVTYTSVDWTVTSGEDIASVDANGVVTAYAPGDITVTATTRDGSRLSASISLKATRTEVPITGLKWLSWPKNHSIEVGEMFEYEVGVVPDNATEIPVFSSTDTAVATVDQDGVVTGIAAGKTYIIVRTTLEPIYISFTLNVVDPGEQDDIDSVAGQDAAFDIYDLHGQCVRRNATDLQGLRPGIYFAKGRKFIVR